MATKVNQALDDRRRLEDLAGMFRVDGEIETADELEAIARRIENPPVEVIEQVALKKSPGVPDGWSWTDIGPFTGKFSGIRLQKGEPVVEQCGHVLLVRQGETSLTERQMSIYEQLSRAGVNRIGPQAAEHVPSVHVLVVFGFQGARHGFMTFSDGQAGPWRDGDAVAITNYIRSWLEWTWEPKNVLVPRKQPPRPPRQPRLDDAA